MIWIIEDDEQSATILRCSLSSYEPLVFASLGQFKKAWKTTACKPALVIADLNLPDGNFIHFLEEQSLLTNGSTRFIVISASDERETILRCYSLGINDYLVKPLSMAELQIKAERNLDFDSQILKLDSKNLRAIGPKGEVRLTSKQFQIAAFFLEIYPDKVQKSELQKAIWKETRVNDKNIQVHISLLRTRLKDCGIDIVFDQNAYKLIPLIVPIKPNKLDGLVFFGI